MNPQEEYILKNYGRVSTSRLSKQTGYSIGSIYYLLKQQNLDPELYWWSKSEVKSLKELYPDRSNEDLEKILKRSRKAIEIKATDLALKKDSWWSSEELQKLRRLAFYGTSIGSIAKQLNRKRTSITAALEREGLLNYTWTKEETEEIRAYLLSNQVTIFEAAAYFDKTPSQIRELIKQEKIPVKIKRTSSIGNDKIFKLLKDLFPNYRIESEYLISNNLRLDFFIPALKLAFEFDGIQHFKFSNFFHKDKKHFEEAKERDRQKSKFCLEENISLIRIRYNEDLTKDLLKERIDRVLKENKKVFVPKQKQKRRYKWVTRKILNKKNLEQNKKE
jgi:very-short-patch-repair endonuclease